MSKGLGSLQREILQRISNLKSGKYSRTEFYLEMEVVHWGEPVTFEFRSPWLTMEQKKELNRRRASICQSLTSLMNKGFIIEDWDGLLITEEGKEAISIK